MVAISQSSTSDSKASTRIISFLSISGPFRNRNEIVEIQKRLITEAKEVQARLDETRQKKIEEKVNNQLLVSCAWKKKR